MVSETTSKRALTDIQNDIEVNRKTDNCIEVICEVNSKSGRREFGHESEDGLSVNPEDECYRCFGVPLRLHYIVKLFC